MTNNYQLNTCNIAYRIHKKDADALFAVDQDALNRTILNRAYYALFNKIIVFHPNIMRSSGGKKHDALKEVIRSNDELFNVFSTLQDLRVWADYNINETMPQGINLTTLIERAYSIIKREGL